MTWDDLKSIWFEVLRPATVAEIVCIGAFGIAWMVLCALMSGA